MKSYTRIAGIFMLLLFSVPALAQIGVGKLNGKVTDAQTKEPLIGANVVIVNTDIGAATNIEGEYFILNITPGTYSVKVSYVGYAPKTIQDVRVVAGITYELNVELSTDFTLPEIVVQDRKLFEEKATNTTKVFDSDQISRIPVRGISNIASLQSGVVKQEGSGGQDGNATINVRGGRGSEVLYIVDGVPQNNLYNRESITQVSNNAIEQISFQVGGYEAKYGQAQSGIINVTTKSGQPNYNLLVDVTSSSFTDDYGYNLYSATLSGPIIPGINEHTIFLSGERGWFMDADPPAIKINFPSIGKSLDHTPDNPSNVWRLTGKTNHKLGDFIVNLSAIVNTRVAKNYSFRYMKNDSPFLEEFTEENYSFNSRISQTVSANTYWNLNLGYRIFEFERYNPFFKNDLMAYGDSSVWAQRLGVTLLGDGRRTADVDEGGIFRPYGWANGLYQHRGNEAMTADFDITSQIDNHLLEFGAGVSQTTVRGYGIFAYQLAGQPDNLTLQEKYAALQPFVFGYDITGQNKTYDDEPNQFMRPRKPIIGYAYVQDRFELEDLVLNVGVRMDYFDIKSYELIDPSLPYAGGTDPNNFDIGDFKVKEVELEFSPRIGLGFPVTENTVFHAQYGRFIQVPELNNVYAGPYDYDAYISMEPQSGFNGALLSEETVQYEVGFKQIFNEHTALQLTLFYKNIKGLVNVQSNQFRRTVGGEVLNAIYPVNSDFGTTKGLALSLDVTRLNYFSVSLQYTYSIAEGTGSSTSSSQTAVFRNNDRLAPKVIAALDFDQAHTGIVNLDFYIPKGELGWLEMFNANFLFSFNSGRPYTPLDKFNLVGDNGLLATTTGYVNSTYGPGAFRIDMKIEKTIPLGSMSIVPYVWIENLLDADNVTTVYRSTGSPTTTGWLNTEEGQAIIQNQHDPEAYVQDYISFENNPANFGIPRLIKLGLKINFSSVGL
jgi:outer membrane receptor protein involved in Fe transport